MYIYDDKTKLDFMIDTGSPKSFVCAKHCSDFTKGSYYNFQAINGSTIRVVGKKCLTISLGLEDDFTWEFLVAENITSNIIGCDFLASKRLLVDLCLRRLTKASNTAYCTPDSFLSQISHFSTDAEQSQPNTEFDFVYQKYSQVFDVTKFSQRAIPGVTHHIVTDPQAAPIKQKMFRFSPEKEAIIRKELDRMLDLGVIIPSSSPFRSNIVLVQKSTPGEFRLCIDYRFLNAITSPDTYSTPFLSDFVNHMAGSCIYSRLDLKSAYWLIKVAPEDIPKTAFSFKGATYCFQRMPFGLRNSMATFQRAIDHVLQGLSNCFVYCDDIIIFSSSAKDHKAHLAAVFDRLLQFDMIVNKDKCILGADSLTFLGHKLSKHGVQPLESKVKAIIDFPKPTNMRDLRRFLGMINFYRRFIPKCSTLLAPLNKMIKPSQRGKKPIDWITEANEAFDKVKDELANTVTLDFPVRNSMTRLYTDASLYAAGGLLTQIVDDTERPLAFFSKNFNQCQSKYSTIEREALAASMAVRHFRYYLEGRNFVLLTDHKPLVAMVKRDLSSVSPRLYRYLSFVLEFTADFQYIPGDQNLTADLLSRSPVTDPAEDASPVSDDKQHEQSEEHYQTIAGMVEDSPTLDFKRIASEQFTDPTLQDLIAGDTSLQLRQIPMTNQNISILCDISTGQPRPLLPQSFRRQVFDKIHGLSHGGIKATQKLMSTRYVWPQLLLDCRDWVRRCIPCQQSKIHRHAVTPLQKFKKPDGRFSHIHVDILGPLPPSNGYSYILMITDRFTRFMVAAPLRDITAKEVANALILNWVSYFGVPMKLTTDRGSQFTSVLFRDLAAFMGTHLIHTTAYHASSDGAVERKIQTLKRALRAHTQDSDWINNLGWVVLGLHATMKADIQTSPAELTFGTTIRLPGEFFEPPAEDYLPLSRYVTTLSKDMEKLRYIPPREPYPIKTYVHKDLWTCSHVFVRHDAHRKPLSRFYDGPFLVLDRSDKYFTLLIKNKPANVSLDRLKQAYLPGLDFADHNTEQEEQMPSSLNDNLQSNLPFQLTDFVDISESDTEEDIPSSDIPQDIDELPADTYTTRRGRIIRKPHRYR
ncbi:unnamed protein product [Clavelina lepadiformis]|uniref:Gypsy retrotransposon integrase-like protein 1 n=1 Tax=Clavelina lepadiformis TaxID=159417 RepID=A0ABP0FAZ0_CLALP